MNWTLLIPLIALLCSIIIAVNNFFGLRDRIRFFFLHRALIGDYCKLVAQNFNTLQLPLPSNLGKSRNVQLQDVFLPLPLELIQAPAVSERLEGEAPRSMSHAAYVLHPTDRLELSDRNGTAGHPGNQPFTWNRLAPGKKFILTGERGSGKSTLLKWLAYTYSSRKNRKKAQTAGADILPIQDWIPILLRCADIPLTTEVPTVQQLIKTQINGLPKHLSWTERLNAQVFSLMNMGKVLLLIDGIDEIPDAAVRRKFCAQLNSFSTTYPATTLVITALNTVFSSVVNQFSEEFEVVQISGLNQSDKTDFVAKWAKMYSRTPDLPEFRERLQNEINGSHNLARLAENIQLLTLLVQLYQLRGALPDHRTEIIRRSITALVERDGNTAAEKLAMNEVMPQLEFLAYQMKAQKINRLSDIDMVSQLNDFKKNLPHELTEYWKPPAVFLQLIAINTGLLFTSGKEIDQEGLEREYYQFFHQTFQDFFAAQAILHGRNNPASVERSEEEQLIKFVAGLEIEEREVPNMGSTNRKEMVFAENWQEVAREMADNLSSEQTDVFLSNILFPSLSAQAGESRARAVFAANILTREAEVSTAIAEDIINTLVENIQTDIDHRGAARNTSMDETLLSLAKSPWKELLKHHLVNRYFLLKGSARSTIGSILSTRIIETEPEFALRDLPSFQKALEGKEALDEKELLLEILSLMNFAFLHPDQVDETHKAGVHQLIDHLLELEGRRDAIQTAAIWTIGWLTQAKQSKREKAVRLNEEQVVRMVNIISSPDRDSHLLYWACLTLSCLENASVASPDWIYEWAVVADRGKDWTDLPKPEPERNYPQVVEALMQILHPKYHPIARQGAVISLGRLNIFPKEAFEDLLRTFKDESLAFWMRGEAVGYMVQSGFSEVGRSIYEIYQSAPESDDVLYPYSFLALLGLGDIDLLEEMFVSGSNEIGVPSDRRSIIHVLATHPDPRGMKLIVQFMNMKEVNARLQAVIKEGLTPADPSKSRAKIIQDILAGEMEREMEGEEDNPLEATVCILLVRGENPDGGAIYAYVAVRADRLDDFMEAQQSGIFYPEDFGVIVESGEGEPSEEVKRKMEEEYGYSHDQQIDL